MVSTPSERSPARDQAASIAIADTRRTLLATGNYAYFLSKTRKNVHLPQNSL
ncbi:hypothetical protein AB6803_04620 [Rhizobium sp. RCC_161_2]